MFFIENFVSRLPLLYAPSLRQQQQQQDDPPTGSSISLSVKTLNTTAALMGVKLNEKGEKICPAGAAARNQSAHDFGEALYHIERRSFPTRPCCCQHSLRRQQVPNVPRSSLRASENRLSLSRPDIWVSASVDMLRSVVAINCFFVLFCFVCCCCSVKNVMMMHKGEAGHRFVCLFVCFSWEGSGGHLGRGTLTKQQALNV